MQLIQDIITVHRDAIKAALPKLRFTPILALAYLLYQVIQSLISLVGSRLATGGASFLWGFVVYLVNIALLAHFLTLMTSVIRYGRLDLQDLVSSHFTQLMPALIQAFFIIYVIELIFSLFLGSLLPGLVTTLILLAWSAFQTPVSESVYLANRYGLDALRHTLEFWKTSWAQWLPVILISWLVRYTVGIQVQVFASALNWRFLVGNLLIGFAYSAWMIWRGELFVILDGSTMRSRAFRRRANR